MLSDTDPAPVPVPHRHLCTSMPPVRGEREVQLCLCLVNGRHAVVSRGVEEAEQRLGRRVSGARRVCREGRKAHSGIRRKVGIRRKLLWAVSEQTEQMTRHILRIFGRECTARLNSRARPHVGAGRSL